MLERLRIPADADGLAQPRTVLHKARETTTMTRVVEQVTAPEAPRLAVMIGCALIGR